MATPFVVAAPAELREDQLLADRDEVRCVARTFGFTGRLLQPSAIPRAQLLCVQLFRCQPTAVDKSLADTRIRPRPGGARPTSASGGGT